MMEEVTTEDQLPEKLADAKIADELQEAALTNVTQAVLAQKESTPPRTSQASSTSPVLSNLPPPSELPPQYSIPPPSELPPEYNLSSSFTSSTSSLEPVNLPPPAPINLPSTTSPLGSAGPPPPSTGFVPSKGIVSATPVKQAFNPVGPAMTPPSAMFSPTNVTMLPTVGNSPSTDAPVYTPPPPVPRYTSPPQPVTGPREATLDLQDTPEDSQLGPVYSEAKPQGGLFGWLSGRNIVSKVVEKTKSSVETMITTLDPGMKEVIYSGGDVNILVTSSKEVKVGAVRQAFQEIFGRATIVGVDSQPNIAPQPVGYTAGLKGAEERIEILRHQGKLLPNQVSVSIENFIVEHLPDKWYDVGCIILKDRVNQIDLQLFTQATPIPPEYITRAQEQTPHDYNLRWSGLAVTIGQVINQQMPYVDHSDWHSHLTGVSRKQMIYLTAKALAGMYKSRLPYVPQQQQPNTAR